MDIFFLNFAHIKLIMSLVDYNEKMGVPVLVSEKFVFEKGIYSSKIHHILDSSHFPLIVN